MEPDAGAKAMTEKRCPKCDQPMEFVEYEKKPKMPRWWCRNPDCDQFWVKGKKPVEVPQS